VQVEPIKPVVIAPGTMLLKPAYDEQLSNLAVSFNLRRYTMERDRVTSEDDDMYVAECELVGREAGAYTRPLFSST
jgi:hypothetical protein